MNEVEATLEATRRVQAVAADPEARYALRKSFYDALGSRWGDAELAFLRWEIGRGVLNETGGSEWWKGVQDALARAALTALLLHESDIRMATDRSTAAWLRWIQDQSGTSWYRAHNTSVVSGYLHHEKLAHAEIPGEQCFLNEVLYRVLYAASLVDEDTPGCLPLPRLLLRILADPRTPAVNLIVHLPDFYPRHYPLQPEDVRHVLHKGWGIQEDADKLMDEGFVLPHLEKLYAESAAELGIPDLMGMCSGGKPCYPRKP